MQVVSGHRKRIAIVGVTGFVGRHLADIAASRGHYVVGFSRRPNASAEACHEVRVFREDGLPPLDDVDAVVNLAGESVLGWWTRGKRRRILSTRIQPTRLIVEAIGAARMAGRGPQVLVNASATGFYGNTRDVQADERSPAGSGFLAETCVLWEAEALRVRDFGVRHTPLRIGFVLGRDGGAMPLLRKVFKASLGGVLGSGKQWMPWVHVEDVARMALIPVEQDTFEGPLNAVGPEPVTNRQFTRAIARAVKRPAIAPAPGFLLRIVLGQFSSLVLDSQRVVSAQAAGFPYRFDRVEEALADCV